MTSDSMSDDKYILRINLIMVMMTIFISIQYKKIEWNFNSFDSEKPIILV